VLAHSDLFLFKEYTLGVMLASMELGRHAGPAFPPALKKISKLWESPGSPPDKPLPGLFRS